MVVVQCQKARTLLCTERVAMRYEIHTANMRVAPEPTAGYFPAGRWAASSRARARVRPRVSASPLLLRSGARGDSPAARITSPLFPRLWLAFGCLVMCHPMGGRFGPAWTAVRAALTPLAPLPWQSGRRGYAPANDHPVGGVARAVVPPFGRPTRFFAIGSPAPRRERGGLRAERPIPALHAYRQAAAPQYWQKPCLPVWGFTNGFLLGRDDIGQQSLL